MAKTRLSRNVDRNTRLALNALAHYLDQTEDEVLNNLINHAWAGAFWGIQLLPRSTPLEELRRAAADSLRAWGFSPLVDNIVGRIDHTPDLRLVRESKS